MSPAPLRSELDEQGLQVAALSLDAPPLVVKKTDVTICSPFWPHQYHLGHCGAHFVGFNLDYTPWSYSTGLRRRFAASIGTISVRSFMRALGLSCLGNRCGVPSADKLRRQLPTALFKNVIAGSHVPAYTRRMTQDKWEKFFFHIVSDGIRHEDDHGTELASLEDAYIHAQSVARWLGKGAGLTNGFEPTPGAYIEIETGSGRILMLCTVAHLLAMSGRNQAGRIRNRLSEHKIIDFGQYRRLRQLGNRAGRRSMFSRQTIMRYVAERECARAKRD